MGETKPSHGLNDLPKAVQAVKDEIVARLDDLQKAAVAVNAEIARLDTVKDEIAQLNEQIKKLNSSRVHARRRLIQIASQFFFAVSLILLFVLVTLIIAAYIVLRPYDPKPRHRNVPQYRRKATC